MSTGYYYYNARLLAGFARILGEDRDAADFAQLAERISLAFNRKFFDPATGRYVHGNQAAQAFALFLGVVPEEARPAVVQPLLDAVAARDYHLTTGNLCTKYLLEMLTEYGQVEAAYRLATQTTYPSWGYTIAHGATTIWEIWEYETGGGMNSHNHPMYGTIGSWFYKYLAGITFDPDYPACERVVIKPYFPADLTFVKASLHTVQGKLVSHWERIDNALRLQVAIPGNCTATVSLPIGKAGTIREGDLVIWQGGAPGVMPAGIAACRLCGDRLEVSVGSGTYRFVVE
jgi:alpha-L-rhamnosidase